MIILYIINLEIARDQKIERERVEEIDRRRKRQKKRYDWMYGKASFL